MQFGATLKELLSYTDIKMYNLADELGYGKSYLSKWVNGVKLPSPKDIDALSYQIAEIINSDVTVEGRQMIISRFNFPSSKKKNEFTVCVAKLLRESYWSSKVASVNEEKCPPIPTHMNAGDLLLHLLEENKAFCDLMLILPQPSVTAEFERLLAILEDLTLDVPVKIDVLLHLDAFDSAPGTLLKWIMRLLTIYPTGEIRMYDISKTALASTSCAILVSGEELAIYEFSHPLSNEPFCLYSFDTSIIRRLRQGANHAISGAETIINSYSNQNEWFHTWDRYSIQERKTGIYREMHPIHMSDRLFFEIMRSNAFTSEIDQVTKERYLEEFNANRRVFIFESVLRMYAQTGALANFQVRLTPEQRRCHFEDLINRLQSSEDLELIILNDENPFMRYQDMKCSLFYAGTSMWFEHNTGYQPWLVESRKCTKSIREYAEACLSDFSEYAIYGPATVNFLRKLCRSIQK